MPPHVPAKRPDVLAAETERLTWAKAGGHTLDLIDRSDVALPALFEPGESEIWLSNIEIAYLLGEDAPFQKPGWSWTRAKDSLQAVVPVPDHGAYFTLYFLREYSVKKSGNLVWMVTRKLPDTNFKPPKF